MRNKARWLAVMLSVNMLVTGIPVYAADAAALTTNKVTVNVGESYDVDLNGVEKEPSWTSWNLNRVKVDDKGVVTGVRAGTATVTARDGLKFHKVSVKVMDPTIKLNKKDVVLYTGGTATNSIQLKGTTKGSSKTFAWESSNPDVATVDATGKVTSVGPGVATIRALANGEVAECKVTVKQTSISLNTDSMQLSTKGAGSSIKLTPTVVGSNKKVTWTTSDKNIARVASGKVTGKSTGNAVITATSNGVSVSCNVIVKAGNVSISEETVVMYPNETKKLKSNATKKETPVWSSSNSEAVTVDDKGTLSAKDVGTSIVSVSMNDTSDTCIVNVNPVKTRVGEDKVELYVGKSHQLGLQVLGRNAKTKWTSSDKKVVTVNGKGKLVAKKAGTATVTATANGVSDTVTVVVRDAVPTVTLNYEDYVLYTGKGNAVTLKAKVTGKSKAAEWISSDESVVTVNKGKVKALKPGIAVVTVSANGVSEDCTITVKESKVVLDTDKLYLTPGESTELPVDVVGASQTTSYKSGNNKVATVKKGVVTAKTVGETSISVKANGVTEVCEVYVDNCKHEWDITTGTITKEPTCLDEGEKTTYCKLCQKPRVDEVATVSHNSVEIKHVNETCTTNGTSISECTVCKETFNEIIPAKGHAYGEVIVVTTPSNFTPGINKQICANCGDELITVVDPVKHEPDEHVMVENVVAPTCTTSGYTIYLCDCGYNYTDNVVPAIDHDYVDGTCSMCGDVKKNDTPLTEDIIKDSVSGDTLVIPETVVDKETGEEKTITTIPDKAFEDIDGVKEIVIPDTITEIGKDVIDGCDDLETIKIPDSVVDIDDDAFSFGKDKVTVYYECTMNDEGAPWGAKEAIKVHDWADWKVITNPTEEADGVKSRTCNGCGEVETEALGKLEHVHAYKGTVIEPTCTEYGHTEYKCACGESYFDTEVAPLGHFYSKNVCTRCGDVIVGATELTPEILDKILDDTVSGNDTLVIPDTFEDQPITSIPDGAFEDVDDIKEIIIPEGVNEIGSDVIKGCDDLEKITIPSSVKEIEEDAFDYGKDKVTIYYNCNTVATGAPWGAKEAIKVHTWSEWEVVTLPTVKAEGLKFRECSTCLEREEESIPVIAHDHEYTSVVTDPTCTEDGYTTWTCPICDDVYTDTVVPATGHSFVDGVCSKCETEEPRETELSKDILDSFVSENTTVVEIPETYVDPTTGTEKQITSIPDNAFEGLDKVTEIVIPATVREIGSNVVDGCDSLETVKVPGTVTEIADDAFDGAAEAVIYYGCTVDDSKAPWGAKEAIKEHKYVKEVVAPTCEADGYTSHTCDWCKDSYNDTTTTATGHNFVDNICSNCGESDLDEALWTEEFKEDLLEDVETVEGSVVLTVPGKVYNSATGTPQIVTTIPTQAFSGMTGVNEIDLPETTRTIEEDVIEGCTDLEIIRVPGSVSWIAPNAFSYGEDKVVVFYSCNLQLSGAPWGAMDAVIVHDMGEWEVVNEATCVSEGTEVRTCKNCAKKEPNTIPKTGHKYVSETVDPTCTENGYTMYSCMNCTNKYKADEVPARNHSWLEPSYTWAPDLSSCTATRVCSRDHDHDVVETVETQSVLNKAATCTENGLETYYAQFVGEGFSVSPKEHIIPAKGHAPEADFTVDTPPTCTEPGSKSIHCANCTEKFEVTPIPANDHTWTEYETIQPPTCEDEGIEKRECTVCGLPDTRGIDANGHKWEDDYSVDQEATCTSEGSESIKCSVCKVPGESRPIPVKDHTYPDTYELITEVTCTVDGLERRLCTVCGNPDDKVTTAPGHSPVTDAAVAATCQSTGLTEGSHCDVCKDVLVPQTETVIDSSNHEGSEVAGGISTMHSKWSCCNVVIKDSSSHVFDVDSGKACSFATCTEAPSNYLMCECGYNPYSDEHVIITGEKEAHHINVETGICYTCADYAPGAYDEDGYMLASWDKLVNDLGLEISRNHSTYDIAGTCNTVLSKGSLPNTKVLVIDDSVTHIGDYAISFCDKITSVILPESVESIGARSFTRCGKLTSITLQDSLTSIGGNAFDYCTNLKTICYNGIATGFPWGATNAKLHNVNMETGICSVCGEYVAGAYDADGNLIADWDSLGMNVSDEYTYQTSTTDPESPAYILKNNSELADVKVLVFPDSVQSIGDYAFYGCKSISSIVMSDSVTTINSSAFAKCSNLSAVRLSNSLQTIDSNAFSFCSNLTSIIIPSSVTHLEGNVFSSCDNLSSIKVESENTTYDSRNNCNAIIETASDKLITGSYKTVIPGSVKTIGSGAFYLETLESIVIPLGVKFLDAAAFQGCSNLISISIPDSVEVIGDYAFSYCSNLETVIISNNVTDIGNDSFSYGSVVTICYDGTATGFPWGATNAKLHNYVDGVCTVCGGLNPHVCSIDVSTGICTDCGEYVPGAYDEKGVMLASWDELVNTYGLDVTADYTYSNYKTSTTSLYYILNNNNTELANTTSIVLDDFTKIGNNALRNCTNLTSVTIPNSVTSIGDYAFSSCTNLTSIIIPNSVTSVSQYAFYNCTGLTSVTIENGVTSIGNDAFSMCTGLTSVTIPNSVTSIGAGAFSKCTGLTSINIPDSVTSIGSNAFSHCTRLTGVTIGNGVTSIGSNAFYNCTGLTSIRIPNSVTKIEDYAFYNCKSLTAICYDGTATGFPWGATNAKLHTLPCTVCGESKSHVAPDDCVFSSGFCIECGEPGGAVELVGPTMVMHNKNTCYPLTITPPVMTGSASSGACCASCGTNIAGVFDEDGKVIATWTELARNYGLTDMSKCNSVLNNSAFANVRTIVLPNTITEIPSAAFMQLSWVKNIVIPNSVTKIGGRAFYESGIQALILPDSVTSIGNSICAECPSLGYVYLSSNLTDIPAFAFENCSSLRSTNIPANIKTVGNGTYSGCTDLHTLLVHADLTSVGTNAFSGVGTVNINCTSTSEGSPWGAHNVTVNHNIVDGNCTDCTAVCNHSYYVAGGTADAHSKCERCGATTVDGSGHVYNVESNTICSSATCTELATKFLRCECGYNPEDPNYVKPYGSLGSHNVNVNTGSCYACGSYVPGAYDDYGNIVITWGDLINKYYVDFSQDYASYDILDNRYHISTAIKNYGRGNNIHLVLGDGVESIGENAIRQSDYLVSVVVPETVSEISRNGIGFNISNGYVNVLSPNTVVNSGAVSGVGTLCYDGDVSGFSESMLSKLHNVVEGDCTLCSR